MGHFASDGESSFLRDAGSQNILDLYDGCDCGIDCYPIADGALQEMSEVHPRQQCSPMLQAKT